MSQPLPAALLLAINLFAFAAFWFDKRAAIRGEWRVRESTLLLIAFLGGSSGALLAQQVFRHKTRKQPFRSYLLSIAILHIVLAIIFVLMPEQLETIARTLIGHVY